MKKHIFLIYLFISSFCFAQNEFSLAESYYRNGEYEKATQIYKKLYSKSPFNSTYLSRLIACYQETDNFKTVENLLMKRIKSNPSQVYLYVFLGNNYERQKDNINAKANYELALKLIEDHPSFAGITGNIFRQHNSLDYAILAYNKAIEKNPNASYSFQIAQIYGEKGNFKQMFETFIDMLATNEEYLNTVQRFASKYITDDAENEGNVLFRKTLLKKSTSNPKNIWNQLLSWLFAQQKEYQKAFIQEKALYQRNPTDISSIFNLGKIAFDNRDFETASACFNFSKEKSFLREEKIDANVYLLKVASATKNPKSENLFSNFFEEFGKNEFTVEAQVVYADFLTFERNNPAKATTVLEEAMLFSKSKFDKARVKLKLGDVLVFRGKFNRALVYFSQIQTSLKNHSLAQEARFKVAQTSYFKGDFTWAKAQLKVLKGSTSQLIANDAVDLFLTISDNEPVDSIPSGLLQYAKAAVLAFQNKNQQAIDTLSVILQRFKGQPIEDEAYFKQATLYTIQKEFDKAIQNYKQVIAVNPEGILIDDTYYQLAELYYTKLKDVEKASAYYQKIIFDHSSSIYLVDARKKYRKLRGDLTP